MKAEINLYLADILDKTISNITISAYRVNKNIHTSIDSVDEDGEDINLAKLQIPIEKALYLAHSIIKMHELDKEEV